MTATPETLLDALRQAFAARFPNDAALIELAENNKDAWLDSIAARHRYAAFSEGYRAANAAPVQDATDERGELATHVHRAADKLYGANLIDGELIRYDYLIKAAKLLRSSAQAEQKADGGNS